MSLRLWSRIVCFEVSVESGTSQLRAKYLERMDSALLERTVAATAMLRLSSGNVQMGSAAVCECGRSSSVGRREKDLDEFGHE